MRKFLALLLTAILVLSLTIPVMADEYSQNNYNGYNSNNGNNNGYNYNNGNGPYNNYSNNNYGYYRYDSNEDYENGDKNATPVTAPTTNTAFGYIGEIAHANDYYEVKILDEYGEAKKTVLVPTTNAIVLDSTTGYPANIVDHGGKQVHVIYNPETNKALVVAINVEYMNVPHLHTIEAIERYGDMLVLTVNNGGLFATLNENTILQAWLTRQIVGIYDFQVGDTVLLWYTIAATSYPAQTIAYRAMRLVSTTNEGIEPITDYTREYVHEYGYEYGHEYRHDYNTEAPSLIYGIVRAGTNLYPVRDNAIAAGFNVVWNTESRRAELKRGDTFITLAPNYAVFYVNGVVYTMPAPSLLENGRLYAPPGFFDKL